MVGFYSADAIFRIFGAIFAKFKHLSLFNPAGGTLAALFRRSLHHG